MDLRVRSQKVEVGIFQNHDIARAPVFSQTSRLAQGLHAAFLLPKLCSAPPRRPQQLVAETTGTRITTCVRAVRASKVERQFFSLISGGDKIDNLRV